MIKTEKNSLENELKQTASAFSQLQGDLTEAQQLLKKYDNKSQQCTSEACRKTQNESDASVQRKTKEIYDLTVKLGCLETENHELKINVEESKAIYENRIDSSKMLIEQEM